MSSGFFWYTEGNSSYNALQTNVTHRLSRNLEFRANYTWSKNLDINSALTGAQSSNEAQMVLNRNNLRQDWGPSALNAAQQASFSAHYELPFGRGKQMLSSVTGIGDKLVSGWQLNGDCHIAERLPFHSADRLESLRRRRHQKPGSAIFESRI